MLKSTSLEKLHPRLCLLVIVIYVIKTFSFWVIHIFLFHCQMGTPFFQKISIFLYFQGIRVVPVGSLRDSKTVEKNYAPHFTMSDENLQFFARTNVKRLGCLGKSAAASISWRHVYTKSISLYNEWKSSSKVFMNHVSPEQTTCSCCALRCSCHEVDRKPTGRLSEAGSLTLHLNCFKQQPHKSYLQSNYINRLAIQTVSLLLT